MKLPKPWFRKQTQTWYVSIDGRQHNLGKDEAAAKRAYHKLMADEGRDSPVGLFTVRQILGFYWKWLVHNCAESTYSGRKPILESFGLAVSPTLLARDLRAYEVQRWIDNNDRIKSPTTVGDRIGLIKGVMNWAETQDYIDRNPIAKMKKPAALIAQEFIPADLWPKVIALATDESFRTLLVVSLAIGSRPQEFKIFEAKYFDGARFVLPIDKSKGRKRPRIIYLPDDVIAIVKRLIVEYPEGPLFRNSKGKPWTNNAIKCRFRRFKRLLKMPGLCARTLRHSFAHHRLTSGQDPLIVSKLMGHVDTRMVATHYGHIEANVDFMTQAANQFAFPLPTGTVPGLPASAG